MRWFGHVESVDEWRLPKKIMKQHLGLYGQKMVAKRHKLLIIMEWWFQH
jgi:hypothetical protein